MKTVLIGGFAESAPSLRHVATYMEDFFSDNVVVFTFAEAMKHPEHVIAECKGSRIITHSAGCLLLGEELNTKRTLIISPSLPKPRKYLLLRAAQKTTKHMISLLKMPLDLLPIAAVLASNGLELLRHPIGNFRYLFNGQISAFDVADVLSSYPGSVVVIALDDEMFTPDEQTVVQQTAERVEVILLSVSHDELFIRPEKLLAEIRLKVSSV